MKDFRNRLSISDQVAEQLLDAVISGEISPGERLIETKLARQFRIGQSTLREALQQLEHKGIVTKYPNRATFVTELTEKAVEEIYSVRSQLEPFAGSLGCKRMSDVDYARLANFLGEMEGSSQNRNFRALMKCDHAFHQHIWKLSGNSTLEKALEFTCAPLFAFYLVRFTYFVDAPAAIMQDFAKDLQDHCKLLTALKSGNPELAEHVFREVISVFRARHLRHIAEIGRGKARFDGQPISPHEIRSPS
jgi:DNA-binding GntR family transcriptional regulator